MYRPNDRAIDKRSTTGGLAVEGRIGHGGLACGIHNAVSNAYLGAVHDAQPADNAVLDLDAHLGRLNDETGLVRVFRGAAKR